MLGLAADGAGSVALEGRELGPLGRLRSRPRRTSTRSCRVIATCWSSPITTQRCGHRGTSSTDWSLGRAWAALAGEGRPREAETGGSGEGLEQELSCGSRLVVRLGGDAELMSADPAPRFVWAEKVLSDAAAADLPTLALAEHACDEMGKVLQRIDPSPTPGSSDRLHALQTLGIVAVRSLRATMALIRLGYASEASVFHRRLSEAQRRVLRVLDPINGTQRAREWLKGRDSTARKVSGLSDETWTALSHPARANHRAVTSHRVHGRDGPIRALLPIRDVPMANAQIVLDAMVVHNVAVLVAEACDLTITGVDDFQATLNRAMNEYIADDREG